MSRTLSRTCDIPWQSPAAATLIPSPARDKSTEIFYLPNYFQHSLCMPWSAPDLKCYSAIVDGTFQSNIVYQIEHLIFDIWVRTQSAIWNCSSRKERDSKFVQAVDSCHSYKGRLLDSCSIWMGERVICIFVSVSRHVTRGSSNSWPRYCFIPNFLPPSGNYILTRSYGAFRKDRNHRDDEDVQYDPLCVSQHKQRQLSNDCTHVYISLMMIDGNNYTYFGLPLPPCPLCSVCTVSKWAVISSYTGPGPGVATQDDPSPGNGKNTE